MDARPAGERGGAVVVVGVGAIGGFVGAALHAAGAPVRFLFRDSARGREQLAALARGGLTARVATDPSFALRIPPAAAAAAATTDMGVLRDCACVLVCTKRTANGDVARQLDGVRAPVVFLQNGLRVTDDLPPTPSFEAIECVVNFNTVYDAAQGTVTLSQPLEDSMLVLDGARPSAPRVAALLDATCLSARADARLAGVQAGKLLMNLTNAVNALSGVGIGRMLRQRAYRLVLASCISEANAVFAAGGVAPAAADKRDGAKIRWFATILRLPQFLFLLVAGRNLKGREDGQTSMLQDLAARKVPTEIEFLNGEIVRRGKEHGVPTPVNARLVGLMKAAEARNSGSPQIPGEELLRMAGLRDPGHPLLIALSAAVLGGGAWAVIARARL